MLEMHSRKSILKHEIFPLAATLTLLTALFTLFYGDLSQILKLMAGWDSKYYLNIARSGYSSTDPLKMEICFFPLYPWLIRIFGTLTQAYTWMGLLVSNGLFFLSCALLFKLAKFDFDEEHITKSLILFIFFPTAYFFHLIYPESTYLATALGCFYFLRKQRWLAAGVLAFLAVLTRPFGLMLIPAIAIEMFLSDRKFKKDRIPKIFALLLPLIALGVYLAINQRLFQNPFQFLIYQKTYWFREWDWPWMGLVHSLTTGYNALIAGKANRLFMVFFVEFLAAAIGLIVVIQSYRRLRLSYAVYATGCWLLVTSQTYWQSQPRHLLSIFPLFLLAPLWINSKLKVFAAVILGCVLYFLFFHYFMTYRWAF